LPASFPQDFKFKYARAVTDSSGIVSNRMEVLKISYPCAMLNADVHARYTNHQYQNLVDNQSGSTKKFDSHSECSIYFELDGPYKAMILPASPEEGKLLKKKYVVFNFDDSIAELKGFELKRRGELEIVKLFQEDVFNKFLSGDSLISCYEAVGAVANYWLDILDSRGEQVDDDELMHYISEKKTISKTLEDYEGRKATSLTTASRISDFLGAEMVKDKVRCHSH
jgi:DNA polymerase epsilon subunit 1